MTYSYKIRSADVKNGTFVVQFEGQDPYSYFIPHNENGFLTGDELEQQIQLLYPFSAVLAKQAATFTNGHEIEARVEPIVNVPSAQDIRDQRNFLLSESDWTQLPDAVLTAEQKATWTTYRQALRDVPTQAGFPTNVTWPNKPQ